MICACMQLVLGNDPHNKSCSKDLSTRPIIHCNFRQTHTRVSPIFAKDVEHSDEVAQCQVIVGHHSLDLMKLCQVSSLVAEHTINGKVFDVLLCLLQLPIILVPMRGG